MSDNLNAPVFSPLKMSEIKPRGWLLNQLKIQAAGLSGNLDKFWPDIRDSAWIGGSAEGWERLPYWLDGFIPLAWLLDDVSMKARAEYYIDYIISHQAEDGWICPDKDGNRESYDVWAVFLILKVLVVYFDATGDGRIEGVVRKALRAMERHLDSPGLSAWGQFRWFEGLISIWWLFERTSEEWLPQLASRLQCQGFNWFTLFQDSPYRERQPTGHWSQMNHVVNNAMMLKAGALLWRKSGKRQDLDAAEEIVTLLDKYHGMVTGVFTGDECLAGTSPVQGTELCAVAEYMYSLEHLVSITGRSHWGDRLERIAYNALPATFSPDMWTHQYDQQVNQVQCSRKDEPFFTTNNNEAHLFGLEPQFGCCTANLSQPWPKLTQSAFMRSAGGLAAVAYAPCAVNTMVGEANVSVELETGYPFRDTLRFTVTTDRKAEFPFMLRIPEWARGATLQIDGSEISIECGGFHCLERNWSCTTTFTLRLPMEPVLMERPNNLFAVVKGPLVYSVGLGERWVRINEDVLGREFPHCDYEIYPTTPWNYGLCLSKQDVAVGISFAEHPIGDCPFSPEGAPVRAKVKAKKVDWELVNGSAAPAPGIKWVAAEAEEMEMIPYGCTNLRITEMPLV